MLGYGEAPRRPMSARRRWLRTLTERAPFLAPGLVGAVIGGLLVLAISGGALGMWRLFFALLLAGGILWLVQRRLSGE